MAGPLAGIRVLDLSRVMAGPWCTQLLADLGAEVVKIERREGGDDTRHWGPPWLKDTDDNDTNEAAYYLSANRGKHSLTLDIATDEGRRIVRDLAAKSDIFIENFKVGDLAEKGLGYDDLCAVNPGIIYCSITGFGQTGPRASQAGYDYLIQGMGGLMSITGVADGEPGAGPQRVGLAVSDLTTGMYSAIGILAALNHREKTGEGQYIDLALLDTQVGWLANQAQNYFTSGVCPGRTGAWHPNVAPYQPFKTKDGYVIIAIGNDGQFRRFCVHIGVEELADDARFQSNSARVQNRAALAEIMEGYISERDSREWMEELPKIAVPCGPINSIDQVFEEPQVAARGMKSEVPHPLAGSMSIVGNPLKFSITDIEYLKAPPTLGEDSDDVLGRILGKSPEEIEKLRKSEII
ncbi:MAG: CaiB/BaiF CoA-transferase family protein [Rhodospirillales bacterium]|nr:CoA transferase [Rhodospirillaceae bacterium]MDP6429498.1 CaiB/BaiF CoA-transferase family protein [Rhodospirillales bacterium]MDP6840865.1 CaiB/BaiF CoA-transferase family protein [Rhodospirillales bacterium]